MKDGGRGRGVDGGVGADGGREWGGVGVCDGYACEFLDFAARWSYLRSGTGFGVTPQVTVSKGRCAARFRVTAFGEV